MKVTISKKQWEMIGKRTRWIKVSDKKGLYYDAMEGYIYTLKNQYFIMASKNKALDYPTEIDYVLDIFKKSMASILESFTRAANYGDNDLLYYFEYFGNAIDILQKILEYKKVALAVTVVNNDYYSLVNKAADKYPTELGNKDTELGNKDKEDKMNTLNYLQDLMAEILNSFDFAVNYGLVMGNKGFYSVLNVLPILENVAHLYKGYMKTQDKTFTKKENILDEEEEHETYDPTELEKHFGD